MMEMVLVVMYSLCWACSAEGYVQNNMDCDDENEYAYIGAAAEESMTLCMQDEDGDGFGAILISGTNHIR